MPQKQRVEKRTGRAICSCGTEFKGTSTRARDKLLELHTKYAHKGEEIVIVRTTVQTRGTSNNNNPNLMNEPQLNTHEYRNRTALELKQEFLQ